MPYYTAEGNQDIYYRISGQGAAAVVFVHGWYQNGAQAWSALANKLKEKYRLVIPDLPGHGLSPLADREHLTVERNHAHILEFIRYIKKKYRVQKVILIGHSYGAFATLRLAAAAPQEFAACIAISAIDNYAPYTRSLKIVLRIPLFLAAIYYRFQALRAAFPYGDRLQLYGTLPNEFVPGLLMYAKIKNRTLSPLDSHAYMRAFLDQRVSWPAVKRKVPLLLVYGERDALTPPAWAPKLTPHFLESTTHVIEGSGHNVQITGVDTIAPLVDRFLQKMFASRQKK